MSMTDCVNVAAGKRAWQSSLSRYSVGNDAERALDDAVEVDYAFHTEREDNPWWMLDLGESFLVERIVLGNRRRTCQENARTLVVEVSLDQHHWLILHAGTLYWGARMCLELAGNIPFRYLRLSLRERQYFHLSKVEVWVDRANMVPVAGQLILMERTDGLGERLNAILNGLMLSRIFNLPFRFSWSDRFLGDPSHAIEKVEEFFADSFIEKYLSVEPFAGRRWEVGGRNPDFPALRRGIEQAEVILAPRLGLQEILEPKRYVAEYFDFPRLFGELAFSESIAAAIALARSIELPEDAVGFHLRSGDVFYGPYRKWVHYTYKGVTLPLAKAAIREMVAGGRQIYLFGQDEAVMAYLCTECGATDITASMADALAPLGRAQRAMFDLVLMSRFKTILAGSSGFAKQASWIGGGTLVSAFQLFSVERQLDIFSQDLAANADAYHPLQTAFAYWYAYCLGRGRKHHEQDAHLLQQAQAYDPDNELYPLVRAASRYATGDFAGGEAILAEVFHHRQEQGRAVASVFTVFVARTAGAYNLKEFHVAYEQAAELGLPFASCLYGHLCGHAGDMERKRHFMAKVDIELPELAPLRTYLANNLRKDGMS